MLAQEMPALEQEIFSEIFKVLDKFLDWGNHLCLGEKETTKLFDTMCEEIHEDLLALCQKDPASRGRQEFCLLGHKSFMAVMHYRIANNIYKSCAMSLCTRVWIAKSISENAKVETGLEIHPAATIGKRFVVDHGVGTVIGETCDIGDDCYILENVILGARGIANNPLGKRHPTVGNNVQIGGFVRVFGPVNIGDNVFISPYCVITSDVHAGARVTIVNQLQITNFCHRHKELEIYAVYSLGGDLIKICGNNFIHDVSIAVIDANYEIVPEFAVHIISHSKNEISAKLCKVKSTTGQYETQDLDWLMLKITMQGDSVVVTANSVLKKIVLSQNQNEETLRQNIRSQGQETIETAVDAAKSEDVGRSFNNLDVPAQVFDKRRSVLTCF